MGYSSELKTDVKADKEELKEGGGAELTKQRPTGLSKLSMCDLLL